MASPGSDQRIEIHANDGDGIQEMTPLEPSTARKMLGCYKEPTGDNLNALQAL